jgi:hypothetical protein
VLRDGQPDTSADTEREILAERAPADRNPAARFGERAFERCRLGLRRQRLA